MKRTLLFFTLLSLHLGTLSAQITVTNESFPMPWDTLFTAVDNLPSNIQITPPGGDQSWELTGLQSPFTRQNVVRPASESDAAGEFPDAELVIDLGNNAEGFLNVTADRVELIGFHGEDPIGQGVMITTLIDPPTLQRRAPINFFDVNQTESDINLPIAADDLPSEIIDQLPISPDSIRIRIHTERLDVVDAWGTMTIPGGIYDVLREKRTAITETRLDAFISFFDDWQDITDIATELLGIEQLGTDTTITYNFFSNEAKEPIAVITVDNNEESVLNVEYKANDVSTNVQNVNSLRPGVYAFPNPAIVNVRFEFSNLRPGRYKLKIYNILGIEEWSQDYYINGSHTEKVEISNLRKGTYLYSLIDDRGKTLSTKRLIVVRP